MNVRKYYVGLLFAAAFLPLNLLLSSCAHNKNPIDYAKHKLLINDSDSKPIEKPEHMYARGMSLVEKRQYKEAIKIFDEIEELYPFSRWAQRATLISAYLNYKDKEYSIAEAMMDNFISNYKNNNDIEYAYYLRAMAEYQQIRDISHDHEMAAKAYTSMVALISRFPNSTYALDLEGRMLLMRYYLAAKDMGIGRFYMKSRQYMAAMMRFNKYLAEYPDTYYTPEALYRLVVCSDVIGLGRESVRYYLLLTYNFPYSIWRAEADGYVKHKVDRSQGKGTK